MSDVHQVKLERPASKVSSGLHVFISYARRDGRNFAAWLEGALKLRGFNAYLDRKDIVPGEPWRTRLVELIRAADTVVFVVTPAAVTSDVCRWEAEQAVEHGKRILPAILKPVPRRLIPPQISAVNDITFFSRWPWQRHETWQAGLDALCLMLSNHVEWMRAQTRYEQLALAWQADGHSEHKLLQLSEMFAAHAWRASRPADLPHVTPTIERFVEASTLRNRYTADEAIFAHTRLANTSSDGAFAIARSFLIHCLREGLPVERAEQALSSRGDARHVYLDIIDNGPPDVATAAWRQLAAVSAELRSAPPSLDAVRLISVVMDPARQEHATSAAAILKLLPLSSSQARAIAAFIDPLSEPRSESPARWPQHHGRFDMFAYLLDAVLASGHADGCSLLHGAELSLGSDAEWWSIYYRALFHESESGRIEGDKVQLRFAQGIRAAQADVEQAIGIGRTIADRDEIPQSWSGVLQELIVVLRRHRQHVQRPELILRLLEVLTPILPKGAFLQLAAMVGTFAGSNLQGRAARALASAAQDESDLQFLIDRFSWERAPAVKSLLLQALVESTAVFGSQVADDIAIDDAALSSHDVETIRHAVRQLQEDAQSRIRRSLLSGEDLSEAFAGLSPGLVAQTLIPEIEGIVEASTEQAFAALTRLLALAVPEAIAKACSAAIEYEQSALPPGSSAAEIAGEWERFCATARRPDSKLQQAAEAIVAQFNWLRSLIDRFDADATDDVASTHSDEATDSIARLHQHVRMWFVRHYDLQSIVQQPRLPAYTFLAGADADFEGIEAVVLSSIGPDVIRALEGKQWERRLAKLKVALQDLRKAEQLSLVWQANEQVETILHAMVRVLHKGQARGGDHFLMRMLTRTGTRGDGGETYAEHEANIADALAVAYEANPAALTDSLAAAHLMDETRSLVLSRLQARTAAAGAALSAQLDIMLPNATVDPASLVAFDILHASDPDAARDLARRHIDRGVSVAVRRKLLAALRFSPIAEDQAAAFRAAVAAPELRQHSGANAAVP
jgi:TIR domain